MTKHHENITIGSAVVGANVGAYFFATDGELSITKATVGGIIGGGIGWVAGTIAPVAIATSIVSIPTYSYLKLRSSRRE